MSNTPVDARQRRIGICSKIFKKILTNIKNQKYD